MTVGSVMRVLADDVFDDANDPVGRTEGNKLVHISGGDVLPGEFCDVLITRADTFGLFGELTNKPANITNT